MIRLFVFSLLLAPLIALADEPPPPAGPIDHSFDHRYYDGSGNGPCGDTRGMMCGDLERHVNRSGAMRVTDNYGRCVRLVRDQSGCASGDWLEAVFVETNDNYECLAGYACRRN